MERNNATTAGSGSFSRVPTAGYGAAVRDPEWDPG